MGGLERAVGGDVLDGTPDEYARMLALARRAIKTADPDALVVGGCFSPAVPRFTQAVLQAGGLD